MQDLFIYLVKVNVVIALSYLFYWCLLRREKFFILNRFFLLGAIVFAFLLPLLPGTLLPQLKEGIVSPIRQPLSQMDWFPSSPASIASTSTPEAEVLLTPAHGEERNRRLSIFPIAAIVYGLISLGFFARFMWQLVLLSRLLKGNETVQLDGIIYHVTDKPVPPFSFFQHLVINQTLSEKEAEQVVAHEKVHIQQGHIADILLAQLVQVAFWINPFTWMLNRAIRLNLEYIADAAVLKTGVDRKAYQLNILNSCLNPAEYELANLFHSSTIKLRIKMMHSKPSPMSHLYKYSLLLPLLLGAYFLINPAMAQPSGRDAKATRPVSPSSPARSNDTDKANLNYLTDGDPTPLMRAAQKGDLALAKLLVENGADVNEAVAGDGSPLIVAAKEGHLQLVTYLVQKGADVNGAVPGDGNPLIAAAANGHASVMAFLVEKGAGVNAIVPGDETALIQAAGRGHLEIVKYLVARGADVHLAVLANEGIDAELRSPLNQALKHGHRAVATFLREKGARD